MDFASQARVMTATAKCLEALEPLTPDERQRAIFGLVITTLDERDPKDQSTIQRLIARVAEEVKR
jgi:hypothetical protein